jgi:hypothetical protein
MSEGSASSGVSLDVQEKPNDPGAQLVTVGSSAHVVVVVKVTQQKSVSLPSALPMLQLRPALLGSAEPVHVYPTPIGQLTAEFRAQESGPGGGGGGGGPTVAVAVHPGAPARIAHSMGAANTLRDGNQRFEGGRYRTSTMSSSL